MKSSHSKLWIIILGGVIGLILGVALPYLLIQTGWKRLTYTALDPTVDRALELIGYNYETDLLYVKGHSLRTYECPARTYDSRNDISECREATDVAIAKLKGLPHCSAILSPTKEPPGHIVDQLTRIDCHANEYTTLAVHHIILDDGSVWQLTDVGIDFDGVLRYTCAPIGATIGLVIGTLFGTLIFRLTRTTSKT